MNNTQPFRMLLVDNDPNMLQLLQEIIQQRFSDEVKIQTASDPKEAKWRLDSEIIDVLITDLEMPSIIRGKGVIQVKWLAINRPFLVALLV